MKALEHPINTFISKYTIAALIKSINGSAPVHRHQYYEIELILEGGGTYNIDGIPYRIQPGSLFIMSPVSFHKVDFEGENKLINISFTPDACSTDYLSNLFLNRPHCVCQISNQDICFFHTLTKELSEHLKAIGSKTDLYSRTVLDCLLGKICNLCCIQPLSEPPSSIQYAILHMQNHFTEDLYLQDVAKIAKYSPNYFSTQFKAYTGKTFKEYLTELRFSFALKLLEHTTTSVSHICIQCGFNDFSHFMSQFKKRYGLPPNQYRKNNHCAQEPPSVYDSN